MAIQVNETHHIKVWHDDFWKLNVANFLMAMAVYMLVAFLPDWFDGYVELSGFQRASAMGVYGVGVYLFGPVCSYLIQRYRRNKVCILSMLLVAASMLGLAYLSENMVEHNLLRYAFPIVLGMRFLLGAFFGLAYMVLNSTLIVDCCDTTQRTLANVVSAWSYRLAVVAGPLFGFVLERESGFLNAVYVAAFFCLLSVGILSSVTFPFKAPDDSLHVFSLDRFFRFSCMPLVVATFAVAALLGMLMVSATGTEVYLSLFAGALMSLAIQKFFYTGKCRVKTTVLCFFLMLGSSVAAFCGSQNVPLAELSSLVLGFSMSSVLANLHLLFIQTADHCQRGTSQSTFILSFESGFSLGMFLALLPYVAVQFHLVGISATLSIVSALAFLWVVRKGNTTSSKNVL